MTREFAWDDPDDHSNDMIFEGTITCRPLKESDIVRMDKELTAVIEYISTCDSEVRKLFKSVLYRVCNYIEYLYECVFGDEFDQKEPDATKYNFRMYKETIFKDAELDHPLLVGDNKLIDEVLNNDGIQLG